VATLLELRKVLGPAPDEDVANRAAEAPRLGGRDLHFFCPRGRSFKAVGAIEIPSV
jgi:hypothetical protein